MQRNGQPQLTREHHFRGANQLASWAIRERSRCRTCARDLSFWRKKEKRERKTEWGSFCARCCSKNYSTFKSPAPHLNSWQRHPRVVVSTLDTHIWDEESSASMLCWTMIVVPRSPMDSGPLSLYTVTRGYVQLTISFKLPR